MKIREQTIYIFGAIILLAVLFFGFDNIPSTQKTLEKSRALNSPGFDIHSLQEAAKKELPKDTRLAIETLESQSQFAGPDSTRIRLLKELSGSWFQLRQPILAGIYATRVAEMEQSATSWSIAGTTFAAALSDTGLDEKTRSIARDKAVEAFENAISLEPDVIEHRINQALSYVETPDMAQPMKGIQMLAGLATSHPESALPPFHLARLAVKTGQMERAEERINQALAIDSTDQRIACLAIDIYTAVNKPEEARKLADRCAGSN